MKKLIVILLLPFWLHAQKNIEPGAAELNDHATTVSFESDSKTEARQRIESYRQRILKGESFSALASQYSDDPGSAKNGGGYQGVQKGQMVKEFEDVAFSLKPGDISEVFETQYGFHFIQLIARNGETLDLRHILVTLK